jgi:hypothetical protein
MTAKEIMQALEAGATITKIERMIFKRGKLVRGCKIEYCLEGKTIRSNQFESIYPKLTKVTPQTTSFCNYKLKTE